MSPKISICVPNLNTLPYLPERFETIFNQTFQDWELLVYDGYSTDGAWEYIRGLAAREPRMRAWQGPRQGTPGSWSPCVAQAVGEYVYIATSDDTMPPDCLEKLVAALECHPECDLAHCNLRVIEEEESGIQEWWANSSTFARSSRELLHQSHVRIAPFDGLLHLLGEAVYISITQLLIRRSLFERIGLFEARWGAIGDFNWTMRAALVASTVHVPGTWGGWRRHGDQATAGVSLGSAEHRAKVHEMIDHALCTSQEDSQTRRLRSLKFRWARKMKDMREFLPALGRRERALPRRAFLTQQLLRGSWAARHHIRSKLTGIRPLPEEAPDLIREWLEAAGIGPVLVAVDQSGNCLSQNLRTSEGDGRPEGATSSRESMRTT